MATLGGTDLGDVQTERHVKDTSLFNFPLPRQDSENALLLDIFGVSRTITIEGIYEGTAAELRTFISTIEGYAVGTQTGLAFVSDLVISPASRTVFIQVFDWSYVAADVSKISYNLTLMEGASVAS